MTAMKKFTKGIRIDYILGIIALVFVGLALYKYSDNKNLIQSPMTPGPRNLGYSDVQNGASPSSFEGVQMAGTMSNASAGLQSNNTLNKAISSPSDLLPNDMNNSWANLNPVGNADLQNISL